MTGNVLTEGGDLVVYPDRQKMLRGLNMRAGFVLLPVAAAIFVLFAFLRRLLVPPVPPAIGTEFTFLPWCVVVFYFAIYVIMLAAIQRQKRPIVTISPEGLTIHTVATQIGILRWDEIAEVRTYTFIYRYVGIVSRDPKSLYRRLRSRSLLIRLNAWCVPLYRLFGIFIAPINIPQEYLPMSADELAAIIRDHRPPGPPRPAEADVWPPPPLAR